MFLAQVIPYALLKPFWHDEIYTILLSRLPSVTDTWHASTAGVDLSPPLNVWLTRAVHAVLPVGHVSTRIPPMIGFYVAMVAVFLVLRRRAGAAVAVTGALLLFFTSAFRFAAEARAYGVMTGLAALALYAWMEAANGRRRQIHVPVLFVSLAASVWNHYFGLFVFAPIVAGELARIIRQRRVDAATSGVVILAVIASIPLLTFVRSAAAQRSTFWAKPPDLSFLLEAYTFLLAPLLDRTFAVVAVVVIVTAIVRVGRPERSRSVAPHEAVALTVAVLIPLFAVALGMAAGIPVVPRYLLCAIPGLAIALPLALWRANSRQTGVEVTACTCLIVLTVAGALRSDRPRFKDPFVERGLLVDSLRTPAPTVVAGGVQFLQLWYYAPMAVKARMHYLADPPASVARAGTDTVERGYVALAKWTPLPVHAFADFVATHDSFRVYETDPGWLTSRLEQWATIEEIGREPGGRLYQVTMRRSPR